MTRREQMIIFREKRLDNGLRAHSTHIVIFVVRH